MDLGIKGRKALVCAASKGLGRACALSLAREGAEVVIVARTPETLALAAKEIQAATGAQITALAADITTVEGRAAALAACPDPDILVNNAGGPPPGDFRNWTREDWIRAVDANMLTPIELIKAPIEELGLSNGARSGLTGFVAGLARKTVRHNVTINNILPGQFATDRLKNNFMTRAKTTGQPFEQLWDARMKMIPAGRFGDPAEFGELCAYLCSA